MWISVFLRVSSSKCAFFDFLLASCNIYLYFLIAGCDHVCLTLKQLINKRSVSKLFEIKL